MSIFPTTKEEGGEAGGGGGGGGGRPHCIVVEGIIRGLS